MLPAAALRQALATMQGSPRRGPWYRAVDFDHLAGPPPGSTSSAPQPLWPGGAARKGARFTPRAAIAPGQTVAVGIECLYLAEDELTPLMEIAGVARPAGSPVALVFPPQVVMAVDGVLSDMLDLTDPTIQQALGTSHQELTGAWVVQQAVHIAGKGPLPPTQVLGQEAFAAGHLVGLRYPSSKNPAGVGLVVFTARLQRSRHLLKVFNQPAGRLQQSLP